MRPAVRERSADRSVGEVGVQIVLDPRIAEPIGRVDGDVTDLRRVGRTDITGIDLTGVAVVERRCARKSIRPHPRCQPAGMDRQAARDIDGRVGDAAQHILVTDLVAPAEAVIILQIDGGFDPAGLDLRRHACGDIGVGQHIAIALERRHHHLINAQIGRDIDAPVRAGRLGERRRTPRGQHGERCAADPLTDSHDELFPLA